MDFRDKPTKEAGMRALSLFFIYAQDEYKRLGLEGEYQGVDLEGGFLDPKGFFLHVTEAGLHRTPWPGAPSCWESAWHALKSWVEEGKDPLAGLTGSEAQAAPPDKGAATP
jgi:hypothetical protein